MAFIIHAEDIQHSAGNRRWHLRKKPLKMRDRPEHNRCKTMESMFSDLRSNSFLFAG